MVSSSNDTQIDGFDNGLLQRPLAPDSQEALRQARVCISSIQFIAFYVS